MPLSCSAIPGLCLRDLESYEATQLIAWYTFVQHLLIAFFFLDIYRGSPLSNWIPSPIFEYSNDEVKTVALSLAIFCFLYMFIASLGLLRGLKEVSVFVVDFFFFFDLLTLPPLTTTGNKNLLSTLAMAYCT